MGRRILFLCTGNSCRSQMAEALLRHMVGDRFEVLSAGTRPAGFIHPLAVEAMERMGVPITGQTSKSVDEIDSAPIDLVITLCDSAAKDPCPVWAGAPLTVHWPLPDPAYFPGTDDERLQFTIVVARRLQAKLEALLALDWSRPVEQRRQVLETLGEL